MKTVAVCLQLLSNTAYHRLRNVEANTIVTNFLLLIAFHTSVSDFIIRMGVTIYANILAYFVNDYIDVDLDLTAENKNYEKALLIKQHKRTALILIVILFTGLLIFCLFYSPSVCFGVILVFFVIYIYSDALKQIAIWDVIGCFFWGIALPWIAIPDFSWHGIQLIILLGLFSSCTEIVQCIRDYEFDKRNGLNTTSVVYGISKSFLFIRVLLVVCSIYTLLVLRRWEGFLLLLPILFNTQQEISTYWMKLRISFGIVWLLIMYHQYTIHL